MISQLAYEETIKMYPEVEFDPPHGPVPDFVPARLDGDVIPNKYHVVAVGDCKSYQGWQFLVRPSHHLSPCASASLQCHMHAHPSHAGGDAPTGADALTRDAPDLPARCEPI